MLAASTSTAVPCGEPTARLLAPPVRLITSYTLEILSTERAMEIINCNWKFKFQCPRHWNGLRETADPNVRTCESCLENVYLCKDEDEVRRRSSQGQCVALGFFRDNGAMLLGRLRPVE
jgi:hypothetical protein